MKLFGACEIQYFELRIFSFNLYVYYLTRGFIASVRAFNLATRAFSLLTRRSELVTRWFELVTREFELLTLGFELVTREFELITRYFSTFKFLLSLLNVGIQIIEIIFLWMFFLIFRKGKTKNLMFL